MPRSPSVRPSTSRVYRHIGKRQLEASLTLPDIRASSAARGNLRGFIGKSS
jgi:hypothetical protein